MKISKAGLEIFPKIHEINETFKLENFILSKARNFSVKKKMFSGRKCWMRNLATCQS